MNLTSNYLCYLSGNGDFRVLIFFSRHLKRHVTPEQALIWLKELVLPFSVAMHPIS